MARLAHEIADIRKELPNRVDIWSASAEPTSEYPFAIPLAEAFARNGYTLPSVFNRIYTAQDIGQTGPMIVVPDTAKPPHYVETLRDIFELVGVTNIKVVHIPSIEATDTLTFFIGPPAI